MLVQCLFINCSTSIALGCSGYAVPKRYFSHVEQHAVQRVKFLLREAKKERQIENCLQASVSSVHRKWYNWTKHHLTHKTAL